MNSPKNNVFVEAQRQAWRRQQPFTVAVRWTSPMSGCRYLRTLNAGGQVGRKQDGYAGGVDIQMSQHWRNKCRCHEVIRNRIGTIDAQGLYRQQKSA